MNDMSAIVNRLDSIEARLRTIEELLTCRGLGRMVRRSDIELEYTLRKKIQEKLDILSCPHSESSGETSHEDSSSSQDSAENL